MKFFTKISALSTERSHPFSDVVASYSGFPKTGKHQQGLGKNLSQKKRLMTSQLLRRRKRRKRTMKSKTHRTRRKKQKKTSLIRKRKKKKRMKMKKKKLKLTPRKKLRREKRSKSILRRKNARIAIKRRKRRRRGTPKWFLSMKTSSKRMHSTRSTIWLYNLRHVVERVVSAICTKFLIPTLTDIHISGS